MDAGKLKDRGNQSYASKKFNEAISDYTKAAEIDRGDESLGTMNDSEQAIPCT